VKRLEIVERINAEVHVADDVSAFRREGVDRPRRESLDAEIDDDATIPRVRDGPADPVRLPAIRAAPTECDSVGESSSSA
jgi:hypothetical protein